MKPKPILFLTLVLSGWFGGCITTSSFGALPPGPIPPLPGVSKGKIETYWLAPYVRVSEGFGGTTVTWFSEDGHLRRQSAVSGIEPGFVNVIGQGETILGVNEDWKITLPPEPPPVQSGYITSTPDSRVFVHEYHPNPGQIALAIYLHGLLTNTVGPFWQYQGRDVELHEDGSASLPIWKDQTHSTAQVLTTDTNGVLLSRIDCGQSVDSQNIASGGKPLSMANQPDLHAPGNEKAQVLAVGFTPKLTIYATAELYKRGPWRGAQWSLDNSGKDWIRTFYAVKVQNGSVVARWQAQVPQRLAGVERDHFLRLGDKLFYVTANEFVELNPEDIISKMNGWQ
jgi:hypothetical protein